MASKKQASTCVQCEGDEMLEIRKHAREAFSVMDMISAVYCVDGKRHRDGTTIVDYVRALINAERDHVRLRSMIRDDAERKSRQLGDLISACRFLAEACKLNSSGVSVSSGAVTIEISELFKTIVQRLNHLDASYKGLIEGRQPHNEKDFMAVLFDSTK